MGEHPNIRAKIVLQNRESLLYLNKEGQWTRHIEHATRFEHVADANAFARNARLTLVDIVMNFGDPRYDVRLPASI
jgi:hypothetical protein